MRRARITFYGFGESSFFACITGWSKISIRLDVIRPLRQNSDHVREGIFQRRALRRQQLGAILVMSMIIFEADAELARDIDAGLVAEGHAGLRRGFRSQPNMLLRTKVGPLVHVHADAVADAVSEVLEAGSVAAIDNDLARRGIHVGCRNAGDAPL